MLNRPSRPIWVHTSRDPWRALLYSAPFFGFVVARLIVSSQQSAGEGLQAALIVLTTAAVMASSIPLGWLIALGFPVLRRRALLRMFPAETVLCGVWTVSFANAMIGHSDQRPMPRLFSTYGLVANDNEFSIWIGALKPARVTTFPWTQVQSIQTVSESGRKLGRERVRLEIVGKGGPVDFALSRRAHLLHPPTCADEAEIAADLRRLRAVGR